MAVPTLNYTHFTSGTQEQRKTFARELLESFERTGFAKLKAHTFSAQELNELFTWVRPRLNKLILAAKLIFFLTRVTNSSISHWM
jgi:isopenicillin N synthase-like dioxygenase